MIEDFLSSSLARPFAWGEVDCCLVLADWLVAKGYPDVAADLRGAYRTEDECRTLISRHGGLVALATSVVGRAGLVPIAVPEPGAIAIIGAAKRRDRQWGAIWDGRTWRVRWGDVFVGFAAHPIIIWRV